MSDRWPPMSNPVESSRSWAVVSPWRLSDPVISQFVPEPGAGLPA